MKVRHRITIACFCPVNGDPDRYVVDVYPDGLLYCEQVRDAAVAFQGSRNVTQESLTQALADRLGCKVRTKGTHCRGLVSTVCVCWPAG